MYINFLKNQDAICGEKRELFKRLGVTIAKVLKLNEGVKCIESKN